MDGLIEKIIKWGDEKGINNPEKQFQKLAEEMLEAHEAWLKEKSCRIYAPEAAITDDWARQLDEHIKEELGDIGVVWVLLCNMLNIRPLDALEVAHEKNKDRKGKTINGNFIKASDLAVYDNIEPITDEDLERMNAINKLIYGDDKE